MRVARVTGRQKQHLTADYADDTDLNGSAGFLCRSSNGLRLYISQFRCGRPRMGRRGGSVSEFWGAANPYRIAPEMRLLLKIGIVAAVLAASLAAGRSSDDPRFIKFKREMLPKVGQRITVVGTLSDGKEGFWLAFKTWGAYIVATRESSVAKDNNLYTHFRSGQTVKVTGTLRYRPDPHSRGVNSKGEHVQIAPEDFFFDVEEITISRWTPPARKQAK